MTDQEHRQLLAQVYQNDLYLDELPLIASALGKEDSDSTHIIQKAVDDWVKDQLFLHEAQNNIPPSVDLEKLVQEYRRSLIRHYFEEKLIRTKLDTVITEFDLKDHYEKNKALYALENNILRCLYLKVPKPVPSAKKLDTWLENPDEIDLTHLRNYCVNNAELCLINPEKWYKWEDVKDAFPSKFKFSDLKKGYRTTFADFKYQYYIHILEFVSKKNEVPFSYIQEQATKLIIRERKNRLLNDLKQQLYDEQREGSNVKIYVK